MPKNMRILFALFITLPILSLTLEPGKTVDEFSKELEKKGGEFREKTGEEQDKILEEVDTSISDLREKLKLEKKEERKEKILDLLKKGLELTRYLKIKACSKEDKNYENCRKNKINYMNNFIDAIEENFGECSLTIKYLTKLTDDAYSNLGYYALLLLQLPLIPDAIEKKRTKIISELIKCTASKFDDYFAPVAIQLANKSGVVLFKDMMFQLMLGNECLLFDLVYNDGIIEQKYYGPFEDYISDRAKKYSYQEIMDILKGANESKKDNTMVIIASCASAIILLIAGFFLYRFIRRRKTSRLIENTKEFVHSENNKSY